jgi:catechol 2,3-dioxygenase-like lactoylglutathione lyase family enzyme
LTVTYSGSSHASTVETSSALSWKRRDASWSVTASARCCTAVCDRNAGMDGIGVERTDFVNVATTDLARAVRFYGETLGLPRNPRSSDDWPEFDTGNLTLLLASADKTGVPFSPSNNAVALRVADVDEAKRRLEAAGVEFEFAESYDTGVCKMAFFRDPDGNALILHRRYAPYSDGSLP